MSTSITLGLGHWHTVKGCARQLGLLDSDGITRLSHAVAHPVRRGASGGLTVRIASEDAKLLMPALEKAQDLTLASLVDPADIAWVRARFVRARRALAS